MGVNFRCSIGACSSLSAGGVTEHLLVHRFCSDYRLWAARPVTSNAASQKHGKSHVPDTRDLSHGGVQTHLSCADTLENSRDGERLQRTARHPPGYFLAETLMHLQFISGIPLGFAEVMVLERQLHSLLLIRWFTVIPLRHSLGPHLTCLAYKKSLAEGSKSRRSRAWPSIPSHALCCAALELTAACRFL